MGATSHGMVRRSRAQRHRDRFRAAWFFRGLHCGRGAPGLLGLRGPIVAQATGSEDFVHRLAWQEVHENTLHWTLQAEDIRSAPADVDDTGAAACNPLLEQRSDGEVSGQPFKGHAYDAALDDA